MIFQRLNDSLYRRTFRLNHIIETCYVAHGLGGSRSNCYKGNMRVMFLHSANTNPVYKMLYGRRAKKKGCVYNPPINRCHNLLLFS